MRSHPGREWKGIHPPNDDDNGLMEPVAVSPIPSSSSPSIDISKFEKNTKLIVRLKTRPQHEEDNVVGDDGSSAEKGFQCNICDEYFATIQSLRGHRSNHNKEKKSKSHKNDGDDNEQIRNITEESSEPSSKILREFDLNELPENNNNIDGGS
ncbi:zinc finger protein ZAT2-like [Arachis duranensis]|uniref:Zinc finger protein ZAT2-like n=1 Tax=Arachis duranensis TaxID=130453 RepID=A0A6P5MHK9_ARADU|nr:zinc finger protein ZAT2-like [Arachis duranensis]